MSKDINDPLNSIIVQQAVDAFYAGHSRRKAPRKGDAREVWLAAYNREAEKREEYDVLTAVGGMEAMGFTVMFMSGRFKGVDADRLVAKGLLIAEMAYVCDGDGFMVEPERERLGYRLSDEGIRQLRELDPEEYARLLSGLYPDRRARWISVAGEP